MYVTASCTGYYPQSHSVVGQGKLNVNNEARDIGDVIAQIWQCSYLGPDLSQ